MIVPFLTQALGGPGRLGKTAQSLFRQCESMKTVAFRRFSTKLADDLVKVCILPALEDNYMYLLIDRVAKVAAAVDPVEPEKVLERVEKEGVKLTSILTTHHHYDHAGGNRAISEMVQQLAIFGGDDRIECMTSKLAHRDTFKVGNLLVECLQTPCHTSGHVCYYVKSEGGDPICFSGDTLFVGGCGRFFEGTADHMLSSLNILASLPHHTKIYCGHEYTLNNLKFAVAVEPNNELAVKKLSWTKLCRDRSEPTVPSTIKDELSYNPFLRVMEPAVQLYTKKTNPFDVMSELRKAKDNFKG